MRRRPRSPGWEGSSLLAAVVALFRARRRLGGGGPAWGCALGVAAPGSRAAGVSRRSAPSPPAVGLVRSGAQFATDELLAITRALGAKHLPYRIDRQNR